MALKKREMGLRVTWRKRPSFDALARKVFKKAVLDESMEW